MDEWPPDGGRRRMLNEVVDAAVASCGRVYGIEVDTEIEADLSPQLFVRKLRLAPWCSCDQTQTESAYFI